MVSKNRPEKTMEKLVETLESKTEKVIFFRLKTVLS